MHRTRKAFPSRTAATFGVIALGLSTQVASAAPLAKHSSAVKPTRATAAASPASKAVPKIRWVPVRHGTKTLRTLDNASRLLLARSAAQRAGLASVGLSFHDVYGVIEAETSWVPRDGMGKNGVASLGLAQFEPATARGLGLQDPNDPVQAVHAAAVYMKHGAEWAARKIAPLKLSPQERAAKLREGVSIYYNLSVRGRNKWNGVNTAALPIETQRHISNVRSGVQEAMQLAAQAAG